MLLRHYSFKSPVFESQRWKKIFPSKRERERDRTRQEMKAQKTKRLPTLKIKFFFSISCRLVNAEATFAKLVEFEVENARLNRLKAEAAMAINNATSSIKRQYLRKKVIQIANY